MMLSGGSCESNLDHFKRGQHHLKIHPFLLLRKLKGFTNEITNNAAIMALKCMKRLRKKIIIMVAGTFHTPVYIW